MKTKQAPQQDPKAFCAVVFVGNAGTSWGYAPTHREAVDKAVAFAKQDWKLKPQRIIVPVYDMRRHSGWYSECPGQVRSNDTHRVLKPVGLYPVEV